MAIRNVVATGGSGHVGAYLLRELAPHFDVVNADLVSSRCDTADRSTDWHVAMPHLDDLDGLPQGATAAKTKRP